MVTAKKPSISKAPVAAPVKTAAVKKPAAKKTVKPVAPVQAKPASVPAKVAPKATAKPKAPAKPKAAPAAKLATLSLEQRNHYVQVAAFYMAERRGFAAGDPAADWAAAEEEVDRLIASGHFNNG
jgi:cell division septation protein DedD